MEPFPKLVGGVLRQARLRRNLTLEDVKVRSRGRFKPSAVGGYERGERTITLERFCALAAVYGTPADRLLAEVLLEASPGGRGEIVVDLNRLALLDDESARLVAEFIHNVRTQRGDYLSNVITLRSGDLEALSLMADTSPRTLASRLRPILRASRRPAEAPPS